MDEKKPEQIGYEDEPITKLVEDRFGFRDYAEVLAKRVVSAEPPLVIGVFGSWGSGKTSLMHLIKKVTPKIQEKLKLNNPIEFVEINVWELSTQEEVWHAFLQALFSKVNKGLRWWQKLNWGKLFRSLLLNSYRVILVIVPAVVGIMFNLDDVKWRDIQWETLREVLNPDTFNPFTGDLATNVGVLLSYGLVIWTILKPAFEAAKGVISFDLKSILKLGSYEAQISALMQLKSKFEKWVQLFVGEEGRLVVFIDDLDRCTPDKIPDVLEAIKLFTGTKRCVYVIGLDREIVRQGISVKYEFDDQQASAYLEKIVQIPFHLPPIDTARIKDFIEKKHSDIGRICSNAPEIFSIGLEPNPRKVKRGLNIYRTTYDLAETRWLQWEMPDRADPELLAKMVILQNRYRLLFQELIKHPESLLDIQESKRFNEDSPFFKSWEKIVADWEGVEVKELRENAGQDIGVDILDEIHKFMAGDEEKPFTKQFTKENINLYIFLTGTAEGSTGMDIQPNREERDILLSGNQEEMSALADEIINRGANEEEKAMIRANYRARLENEIFSRSQPSVPEASNPEELGAHIFLADYALDYFEEHRFERMAFEPKTILIPAGEFWMGSLDEEQYKQRQMELAEGELFPDELVIDQMAGDAEKPHHKIHLPDYRIGRYPITNREYKVFVDEADVTAPEHWGRNGQIPEGLKHHPVVNVTWHAAFQYCQWLSDRTGRPYTLPSEAEWEKAARGADSRIYPWGNEFRTELANISESGFGTTTPVWVHPAGRSAYECFDMAGNVWEWTRSLWGEGWENLDYKYPYNASDGREELDAPDTVLRVVRGGSLDFDRNFARCAVRLREGPIYGNLYLGFRVVVQKSG